LRLGGPRENPSVARSEEQAALNETVFREANERIAARRAELPAVEGRTPFLCECEDDTCTELVRLTLEEYRRVRADPTRFVVVRGHPTRGSDDGDLGGDKWVAVRKSGRAGDIARERA
jgi:hypothetical protein